ncbi:thioredoxin family protein [Streptococcus sciuri]|uniref:Thioredoxin family protein n=1 Tax=Streptococcus sciuri TaxID=2973939 RepID=A0ABT2F540_9STRE|nr:thioredoxin family protein [Streptococcus sciuri]MCS4487505.1 thioredoxin family protein [Streptococcus sciuri]
MKKFTWFIILIIILFFNIILVVNHIRIRTTAIETTSTTMYNKLDSMTVDNFITRYTAGENLIVYIGRPSCGDCSKFEKILEELIDKYKLGDRLIYVNVEELHRNIDEWKKFKEKFNIKGTPTFAIYDDKKLLEKLDFEEQGGFTPSELETWIKEELLTKIDNK